MSSAGANPRAALDARALAWMREWAGGGEESVSREDERFDALARDLFAYQYEHCAAYGRYCEHAGMTPRHVGHWSEIPAVPTSAFKEIPLRCFPAEQTCKIFRTSGTTAARRGELQLDTLELYEASLLPTLRRYLFPDVDSTIRLQILAPAPAEADDSSLSHMFGCAVAALGSRDSDYFVKAGVLHSERLLAELQRASVAREAVALCGTSFAFVHLLDAMKERAAQLQLPAGSRVMETGGFKGRAREVSRDALHHELQEQLGLEADHIVNQYGMTELGSQFYDSVLSDSEGPRRKLGPPWARVRILDPESGRSLPDGEVGIIAINDLANTGSIAAIETEDLGRRIAADGGFEVLGRDAGTEARGCSIAADALLSETL